MSDNIHIFTHNDLDGIGTVLALGWSYPHANITFSTMSNSKYFKEKYQDWAKTKASEKNNKIFITCLALQQEDIQLVDKKNTFIFNNKNVTQKHSFEHAKILFTNETSCTLLLYKLLKSHCDINDNQKHLLILIDDYVSYTFNFKKSKEINTLFWELYSQKPSEFLLEFSDGMLSKYNEIQQSIINSYYNKINNAVVQLPIYKAEHTLQNTKCKIIATFANSYINDITEFLKKKYTADIYIVVNITANRVSFRRSNTCKVDVSQLANKLCNGAGTEFAAGGDITDAFMLFSKIFKLC